MTARDFTPTDEQVEALCRTDFESDQSVLRWDEDCISKPEWREDMRFLIASPAFQSIIAAAKAEARAEMRLPEPTWHKGMYGAPDDMYSRIALERWLASEASA